LAETTAELNLRAIARLSGVSTAQASRVLPVLVELGIVERREAPPSALFRFVSDNVAAQAITALTRARQSVLDELGRTAAALEPRPVSVIVFGTLARGEAEAESELDVVVVRPVRLTEDDVAWRTAVAAWTQAAGRLTGNEVESIEVAEADIGRLLRGRRPLWVDVARDGIVAFGSGLDEMKGRRSA
jgi:predicted nucleotidyltransferase